MSSIIRWRSGVMTRSVAEGNGAETALIVAQRERRVSTGKGLIGEGGQRLVGKGSGAGEAIDLGRACGFGNLPRSGLVQSPL